MVSSVAKRQFPLEEEWSEPMDLLKFLNGSLFFLPIHFDWRVGHFFLKLWQLQVFCYFISVILNSKLSNLKQSNQPSKSMETFFLGENSCMKKNWKKVNLLWWKPDVQGWGLLICTPQQGIHLDAHPLKHHRGFWEYHLKSTDGKKPSLMRSCCEKV